MSRNRPALVVLKTRRPEEPRTDERLRTVLELMKADARSTPREYARDTEVPEGGE